MKKTIILLSLIFVTIILNGCKGTINTIKYSNQNKDNFKKAYIISSEDSEYIKFKFGKFQYGGYVPPIDDEPEKTKVIGNTDTIIKQELERYGIKAIIGKKGDEPIDFDLIVEYKDKWRWDFKKILDELEILFISPDGNEILAKSNFNIYKNKELHNFPTPEKEVPKMIKELLEK
ncbi:hypothetical protein [Aestuariibaculum sediminum]|uniref:Uncharacterized protein n=1 Tax=Aestuariibaculum sediminum TaxID=2770637 RepID=A0A8J6UD38_9FLAO|nr:hypothetical protein [Aestuariibaculum sediminum]MBD0832604.1 hypothetical protein [Aestuariibaculum sediminum]